MAVHMFCTCFLIILLLQIISAKLTVRDPVYLDTTKSTYKDHNNYVLFPQDDGPIREDDFRYFSDKMDFQTIDENILIGGADKLYLFDKNLTMIDQVTWVSDRACGLSIAKPHYVCRNHIRLYEEIPDSGNGTRSLLVCGTQSSVQPECRAVEINSNQRFGDWSGRSSSIEGLISAHPDLPGFGEFRRTSPTDQSFFSASFTTTNTRVYDLSYLDVNTSTGIPTATRQYGWQQSDTSWLNYPVVFVDYTRANYRAPPGSLNDAYHFYFVFLRESVDKVVFSRVVRICRNDPGVTSGQGSEIFSTFLKARIFCFREMPPGPEFVGAQDYQFNEIWSMSFNGDLGGRYHSEGDYVKLMYGAFSGPLIGPPGTAICVYPAFPAEGTADLNHGIFDIFQADVAISEPMLGQATERQNTFVECAPQGRNNSDYAKDIQIITDVQQLGDKPLLVLDGYHVTQMIVDEVCVVRRSNVQNCVNQDVLFLGTDTGLVLKVIMTTNVPGGSGNIEPVIVDEIKLDDTNSVDELKIESVDSVKYLFVSTSSRIYRLPLENCNRFESNFTQCIGSRDPYCVWNSQEVSCERNTLTAVSGAVGNVSQFIRQNIHSGQDQVPEVGFVDTSVVVSESAGTLSVRIVSDVLVSDNVLELVLVDGTAIGGQDFTRPSSSVVNFPFNQTEVTVMINIIDRPSFTRNQNLTMMLRSTSSGALRFSEDVAYVTIIDEQALVFQLALGGLDQQTCQGWINFQLAIKIELITEAVLVILQPGDKLEDNPGVFQTSVFNCTGKQSMDSQEFVVFRSVLDTTKLNGAKSKESILTILDTWVSTKPIIKADDDSYTLDVLEDTNCVTGIQSLNTQLCKYISLNVGGLVSTPAPGGSDAAGGLGAVLGVSLVVNIIIVVLLIVVVVLFVKKRKCYKPNGIIASNDVTDVGGQAIAKQNVVELESSGEPETPKSTSGLIKHNIFQFPTKKKPEAENGHVNENTV